MRIRTVYWFVFFWAVKYFNRKLKKHVIMLIGGENSERWDSFLPLLTDVQYMSKCYALVNFRTVINRWKEWNCPCPWEFRNGFVSWKLFKFFFFFKNWVYQQVDIGTEQMHYVNIQLALRKLCQTMSCNYMHPCQKFCKIM